MTRGEGEQQYIYLFSIKGEDGEWERAVDFGPLNDKWGITRDCYCLFIALQLAVLHGDIALQFKGNILVQASN